MLLTVDKTVWYIVIVADKTVCYIVIVADKTVWYIMIVADKTVWYIAIVKCYLQLLKHCMPYCDCIMFKLYGILQFKKWMLTDISVKLDSGCEMNNTGRAK